jgi:hypothetical protein
MKDLGIAGQLSLECPMLSSRQLEGYVKDLSRSDPELAKGWGRIATPFVFRRQADDRHYRKIRVKPSLSDAKNLGSR